MNPVLSVKVYFDLSCPWCYIGKRQLDAALSQLRKRRPEVVQTVEWFPYLLIPHMPVAGLPYREFMVRRLGGEAAVGMLHARIRTMAREASLCLALDRIEVVPSTLLAHRMVGYSRQSAGAKAVSAMIDELFARYFVSAEDIGEGEVVRQAAFACGIGLPAPGSSAAESWVDVLPPLWVPGEPVPPPGIGVPHFVLNGKTRIAGARPVATLLKAMEREIDRVPRRQLPPGR